ncbi:MAG: class I SAM-dependent methyltransferase [Hyphomicrobiales bacterium]
MPYERQRGVISELYKALAPQFAIELWDGTRLGPATGPCLVINDPYILGNVLRSPRFTTLAGLWIDRHVDVKDGTLFDLAALRTRGLKGGKLRKKLPIRYLFRNFTAVWARGTPQTYRALQGTHAFVSGSDKAAIGHHYDVSNRFYRLFLDQRMVYTCGYFTDWSNDLDQAQHDKLEISCRKLRLKPGDRLLDIGCGWGALLIHAVENFGVTGVGVTLSDAQAELAREHIAEKGLEKQITIHLRSYEDIDGPFDKISSIGMFEHVGSANYDTYFAKIRQLLKPGGLYLHHAITRRMKRSDRAFKRKSPEHRALVKYIFPGGELDHLGMSIANLEKHGFEVHDVENWREHYGRTCRFWANRLDARFDEAVAEVGEAKARLWYLYLFGCALAFERGSVRVNQTLASKRVRGPSGLPPTRADLYRDQTKR